MNSTNAKQFKDAIRDFGREMEQLEKSVLLCCGVTFAQCNTIMEIGKAGSVSLNTLADIMRVDNSTMSQTISKLVSQKFVERELNPDDRRYVTIKLTEDGNRVFEKIDKGMNAYYADVYDSIPEDKRGQIIESIKIMTEILGKKCSC